MERIVLEVDDYTAKAWRNSSQEVKEIYQDKISEMLRELKLKEFKALLDEAGRIAESNGLTEEILEKLLNEKD